MAIKTNESESAATQTEGSVSASSDSAPLQLLSVSIALQAIAQRMAAVEDKLDKSQASKPTQATGSTLLEVCRVIFGGWPALGLLFLILFYSPLRDALNAIPDKVKSADEIGVLGVSLKSTIQVEASRLGVGDLSKSIPRLSSNAIELLLRTPKNGHSGLISYSLENGQIVRIYLPGIDLMNVLVELEKQNLILMSGFDEDYIKAKTVNQVVALLEEFKVKNPGQAERVDDEGRLTWHLNNPLTDTNLSMVRIGYRLTPLGEKAIEVIINSISTELSPTSK